MNITQADMTNTIQTSKSFVIKISIVAALGGLLFGYDTAVIAGAIGFLKIKFDLSATLVGWAASSAIWGCVLGAMGAGYISDRIGRKRGLIITAVFFAVSAIGSAMANDLTTFILARFLGGLGVGAASMLSPLYIAEVSPAEKRGRLVTLYQLAIVIGIILIYFINLRIAQSGDETWNIETGWRLMLGSEVIPAMVFLLLLFFVPESPRWLVKQNADERAHYILEKVNGKLAANQILEEIKIALMQESGSIKSLFATQLRKAMVVGVTLALFSQITGINAIIYYAPEIFKSIGFGAESAFSQTVIIGIVNMLFTFVALWLIDKTGRKPLLLWGISGMIVCLLGAGLCFYFSIDKGPWLLIFILGFIASFASSLGPIPWVMMSEIFPTKTRGIAMSFATLILWLGVLAVTQLTPMLMEGIGGAYTFWLFMINAIILLVFTWRKIPETKNRSLEEIEKIWQS
ncbi:sugar porter family MFS transporter [Fulvivirgaceae bacterium BMA12]|uniref:Sugar porter family MFS transporter n=1 Tax=Agaribacillus aureus TaxID=3051825 RepID=A0ABT8LL98_9BACT|nr:sugar porter family MFS transporter [Fulvivirgaceae bacterium BMA12]